LSPAAALIEISGPSHSASQIQDSEATVACDQLAQRHVNRLALGLGANQMLRLAHYLIVYLDVSPHTHNYTPI
jgi:hypothetical protein